MARFSQLTNDVDSSTRPQLHARPEAAQGGFVVTWETEELGGTNEVVGQEIVSGLVLTDDPATSYEPSITSNDEGFVIRGTMDETCHGNKVGAEVPISSNSRSADQPSIVWTGGEFKIVWQEFGLDVGGGFSLRFSRLSRAGEPLEPSIPATSNTSRMEDPSIAWSGHNDAIAWTDDRFGNREIFFAPVFLDPI